jgi:hypothetical protein
MEHFICTIEEGGESITYQEASHDPRWQAAMASELRSITKNNTWTLVKCPPQVRPITARWLFKIKPGLPGQPPRFKARIMAHGFQQQHGINYQETFAPTVHWDSIRTIIALAAHHGWNIDHLDVTTAFLNGTLQDEVYMFQPPGCATPHTQHLVCKLCRSLYGLKQSPRAWYYRIDTDLIGRGMQRMNADPNVYYRRTSSYILLVVLYVDDLLITGSDLPGITTLKAQLKALYEMTDLGRMQKFLGVEVLQTPQGILLHQTNYTLSILKEFSLSRHSPSYTPLHESIKLARDTGTNLMDPLHYQHLVGKLLYLTKTRFDIGFATSLLSRYLHGLQESHLQAAESILRYLKKYPSYGLWFPRGADNTLRGLTNADYNGDPDDRASTSGYLFQLGPVPSHGA